MDATLKVLKAAGANMSLNTLKLASRFIYLEILLEFRKRRGKQLIEIK